MTPLEDAAYELNLRVSEAKGQWWDSPNGPPAPPEHERYTLAGAHVEVTEGQPRVTAGRVIALGLLALAAQKSTVYLNFTLADGTEIVVARPGRFAARARQFAAAFNNAGRRTA
jgi:hypothetical protein